MGLLPKQFSRNPGGLLTALLCLWPALARAESGVLAWVHRYDGGVAGDYANAVAVDRSNNVIVTGNSARTYGPPPDGVADYVTIKYSSAGVPLWTNRYDGPWGQDDQAKAVAVDGSNDVIVTGWSDVGIGTSPTNSVRHPTNLCATIKYSSAGVPLWTNRYLWTNAYSTRGAQAVAADGSNNVIVAGRTTIKYSSAGVLLWTNNYRGGFYAWGGMAVDGSNDVLVAGNSPSEPDYVTIKYSSAGVPLWTNRYNGPGNKDDYPKAVAVDGSNNVVVTGYSTGSGNYYEYATIKYSSAGVPLWTNRYNGPGNANAVAVESSNDVIVTGTLGTVKYSSAGDLLWTNNSNLDARALTVDGSNTVVVTGSSNGSCVTIKYSSAGVPLWTNRYVWEGFSYADQGRAVAVDRSNNVIVAGQLADGGPGWDLVTIKYICLPTPVMTELNWTNGIFQMRVEDLLQPGTLVIEASTNLAGWSPVFTNTTQTNVLFYTDPEAANQPWRFYRAFQFQ